MSVRLGGFAVDLGSALGRGGAATVWRGVHVPSGGAVAIKVLQGRHLHEPDARAAFAAEVRALAALDHPAILPVYDFGEVDEATAAASGGDLPVGAPWLALELASGGTLAEARHRPGSALALAAALDAVLAALAHAHARRVLHRDVKPANLVVRDGRDRRRGVALGDFGLAAAIGSPGGTSGSAGTPAFAAPEQLAGDVVRFGPWTDLYGLGATARWLAPDPGPLAAWVDRMTAADPADRFVAAAQARAALREAVRAAGGALGEGEAWPNPPGPSAAGLPLADLRRPALVGRRTERAALLGATPTGGGEVRIVALSGAPGVGRTALARWWIETLVERGEAVEVEPGAPVPAGEGLVVTGIDDGDPPEVAVDAVRALARSGRPALVVVATALPAGLPEPALVVEVPRLADEEVADVLQAILPLVPEAAMAVAARCDGDVAEARRTLVRAARAGALVRVGDRWALRGGASWGSAGGAARIADVLARAPGGWDTLAVAAVLGPHVPLGRWRAAAGGPVDAVCDALLALGLAERRGEALRLREAVRRPTLEALEAAGARAEVHLRCLAALDGADPLDRGHHLRWAGRRGEAIVALTPAIEALAAAHRHDRVLVGTQELLACDPPVAVAFRARQLRLHALNHCASHAACEAEGAALLAEAEAAGDRVLAADAARSIALARLRRGDVPGALGTARRAVALGAGTAVEVSCLLLLVDVAQPDEAEPLARRAHTLAESRGHAGQIREARQALAAIARHRGDPAGEERWLRAALALGGPAPDLVPIRLGLGDLARHAGRLEEARLAYEQALQDSSRWFESGEQLGVVRLNLAVLALDEGDPVGCRRQLEAIADGGPAPPILVPLIDVVTAACAAELGDLDECAVRLERLWAFSRDRRSLRQVDSVRLLGRCRRVARAAGRGEVDALAARLASHLGRWVVDPG